MSDASVSVGDSLATQICKLQIQLKRRSTSSQLDRCTEQHIFQELQQLPQSPLIYYCTIMELMLEQISPPLEIPFDNG